MAKPAASILLTFSSGQLSAEHLKYLKDYYRDIEGCEWILVEQLARASAMPGANDAESGGRRLRVANPSSCNAAWGWNVAARSAQGATLIILEPWTLVSHLAITKAASICQGRAGAANLFSRFVGLTEAESARLIATNARPDFSASNTQPAPDFAFGGIGIRADLFRDLGGFDERLFEEAPSLTLLTEKLARTNAPLARFDNSLAHRLAGQPTPSATALRRLEALREEHRGQDAAAFLFANEVRGQLAGNGEKYAQNAITP